ncbi:serine-rich 25 kDa antigen protein-like [Passer montanus]|uniref:serine-rich 25 kDa antigen protein-like n=1 Tax=Passer montanus TaxID=9160 RepID=UPI001960200D|nr:serine-rich 25 kDa antigen protein-like [Passer montanus]XP_039585049.1 serine-rich 25 kDa antigen protein-like [Passer montanus]
MDILLLVAALLIGIMIRPALVALARGETINFSMNFKYFGFSLRIGDSAKMSKRKPTPEEEPKEETISDEESGEETTPSDESKKKINSDEKSWDKTNHSDKPKDGDCPGGGPDNGPDNGPGNGPDGGPDNGPDGGPNDGDNPGKVQGKFG